MHEAQIIKAIKWTGENTEDFKAIEDKIHFDNEGNLIITNYKGDQYRVEKGQYVLNIQDEYLSLISLEHVQKLVQMMIVQVGQLIIETFNNLRLADLLDDDFDIDKVDFSTFDNLLEVSDLITEEFVKEESGHIDLRIENEFYTKIKTPNLKVRGRSCKGIQIIRRLWI